MGFITTEEFIKKSKLMHGDKYDYSKTQCINCYNKVCIVCPEHGEFWQSVYDHLNGKGCPKCKCKKMWDSRGRLTTENFIKKAREIHGDKYDYSKVEYVNAKTPVIITCHSHGDFLQTPDKHLIGRGCRKCADELASKRMKMSADEFISKAKEVHRDKYDYSKVEYIDSRTKVCIICPEHGEFWQTPSSHLSGCGCKSCSNNKEVKYTTESFIDTVKQIHGDKYDYSKVEYKGSDEYVIIICKKHGEFKVRARHLINGVGCRKCGNNLSKKENDISENIKGCGVNVEQGNRKILNGKEIDIYFPEYNIGIEYDGLYWHSDEFKDKNYHLLKTNECLKSGVNLIHIFDDEYNFHKDIVLSKIKHLLHIDNDLKKINARQCIIREISNETALKFLEKNHIQGFSKSTVYLGCFYEENLIGVMTFIKGKDRYWELNRFASDINYICRGVAGKLLSYFKKHYEWDYIKSFADKRWVINEDDNLYTKLGFKKDSILKPDYRYCKYDMKERIHKFNFRKERLHKKYGFPLSMTESEMAKKLGYHKIWDCGLIKYIVERSK